MYTVEIRNVANDWRWVHHMKTDRLSDARKEAVHRRTDCDDHARVLAEDGTQIYLLMTSEGPCGGSLSDSSGTLQHRPLSSLSPLAALTEQIIVDHQNARSELLTCITVAIAENEKNELQLEGAVNLLYGMHEYLKGEEVAAERLRARS